MEYHVMKDDDTKLLARYFQTNYGSMKVEHVTVYTRNGNLISSLSAQDTRKVVLGPSTRDIIINYYIKKSGTGSIDQTYRLIF